MIWLNNYDHGIEIGNAAGAPFYPANGACISRTAPDGRLLGGVTYEGNTGASIIMHTAGFDPHWISRDLLWICFHYPFVQLGVKKVFGKVCSTNTQAIAFNRKLGFREEHLVKDVFLDGDMLIFGMYRCGCRWLDIKPRHVGLGAT